MPRKRPVSRFRSGWGKDIPRSGNGLCGEVFFQKKKTSQQGRGAIQDRVEQGDGKKDRRAARVGLYGGLPFWPLRAFQVVAAPAASAALFAARTRSQ